MTPQDKKMKKEKPNKNRAQLWFNEGRGFTNNYPYQNGQRFRIIYPNGLIEWLAVEAIYDVDVAFHKSCIMQESNWKFKKFASLEEAVQAMRNWDRQQGFPRSKFIANL